MTNTPRWPGLLAALLGLHLLAVAVPARAQDGPTVTVRPSSGQPGDTIRFFGVDYASSTCTATIGDMVAGDGACWQILGTVPDLPPGHHDVVLTGDGGESATQRYGFIVPGADGKVDAPRPAAPAGGWPWTRWALLAAVVAVIGLDIALLARRRRRRRYG